MCYLNINSLTDKAMGGLVMLDKSYIGSSDYMGVSMFWNGEYRHHLSKASIRQSREVHEAFLDEGLSVGGVSPKHLEIIKRILIVRNT